MIIYVLLAAAAAALFLPWPESKKSSIDLSKLDAPAPSEPVRKAPSYIESVACLQTVQKRLAHTDDLEDEQREALNVLVLALSSGSDQ